MSEDERAAVAKFLMALRSKVDAMGFKAVSMSLEDLENLAAYFDSGQKTGRGYGTYHNYEDLSGLICDIHKALSVLTGVVADEALYR